jgi:hypothetical protein
MTDNISSLIIVTCPHCESLVEIAQLNCCIFRHAILKSTMQQIDPHTCKEMCDEYVTKGLIYGCGKPFRVAHDDREKCYVATKCDYV